MESSEGVYILSIGDFNGPLDLLLHLIRKQEIDIHNIPIVQITEQYMVYLDTLPESYLEQASEFVVMAATLLAIKSRMLLPKSKKQDEDEEEMDPRAELVEQLIEYEKIKIASELLKEKQLLRSDLFGRPATDLSPYAPEHLPPLSEMSAWKLFEAMRQLYRRRPKDKPVAAIRAYVARVEDVIEEIKEKLLRLQHCTLRELMYNVYSRSEWVAYFLALLELMRYQQIYCYQSELFGDITIISKLSDESLQTMAETATTSETKNGG